MSLLSTISDVATVGGHILKQIIGILSTEANGSKERRSLEVDPYYLGEVCCYFDPIHHRVIVANGAERVAVTFSKVGPEDSILTTAIDLEPHHHFDATDDIIGYSTGTIAICNDRPQQETPQRSIMWAIPMIATSSPFQLTKDISFKITERAFEIISNSDEITNSKIDFKDKGNNTFSLKFKLASLSPHTYKADLPMGASLEVPYTDVTVTFDIDEHLHNKITADRRKHVKKMDPELKERLFPPHKGESAIAPRIKNVPHEKSGA